MRCNLWLGKVFGIVTILSRVLNVLFPSSPPSCTSSSPPYLVSPLLLLAPPRPCYVLFGIRISCQDLYYFVTSMINWLAWVVSRSDCPLLDGWMAGFLALFVCDKRQAALGRVPLVMAHVVRENRRTTGLRHNSKVLGRMARVLLP